jgi:hypothetical protein
LRGCFCHPDQVFEILIPLPLVFVERRHLTCAAFLNQFRHPGRETGRGAQFEDFFRRGQRGEQFKNIGGAVKAGLAGGIELAEAQFQDSGELLLLRADLRCQSRVRCRIAVSEKIVRKAKSDRRHLSESITIFLR